jgi:hypothetical protein
MRRQLDRDCHRLLVVDSITHLAAGEAAAVVVAASHCGVWAARYALGFPLGAVVMSDAGVGKEAAGIAGLEIMGAVGLPAATVSHLSARIGDGADSLAHGEISYCNEAALSYGVVVGKPASEAVELLKACPVRAVAEEGATPQARALLGIEGGRRRVLVIDSASLVTPEDRDVVAVTGSHGGLLGGRPETAIKGDVFAALYNDAGVGKDGAGISRLLPLDARGIAAATVDVMSARIGESRSTLEDGRISHFNQAAARLGAERGMPAQAFVRLAARA